MAGRSGPRWHLQRPGRCLPARQEPPRGLAPVGHAAAEAADGTPRNIAGAVPAPGVPTGCPGGRPAQPGFEGMGALLGRGRLPPRRGLSQRLGGKARAAASAACPASKGLGLEEVEEAMAGGHLAVVQPLSGESAATARAPSARGPITLHTHQAGKRRAGKPHAAFDVAGAGTVAMVERCTHRAIARARLETLHLKCARQCSTLPVGGRQKRSRKTTSLAAYPISCLAPAFGSS